MGPQVLLTLGISPASPLHLTCISPASRLYLGCWPSLYLLGVQRGGTTALARALSETPGLGVQVGALFDGQALPAPEWELSPRHVKEPHAFDRFFRNGTTNVRSRGHAQCSVRTSVRLPCTVHH